MEASASFFCANFTFAIVKINCKGVITMIRLKEKWTMGITWKDYAILNVIMGIIGLVYGVIYWLLVWDRSWLENLKQRLKKTVFERYE